MSRWLAILGGIFVLAALAAGLTEVTMAFSKVESTYPDTLLRPKPSMMPSPKPSLVPTPTPTPVSTPLPTPVTTVAPGATATTVSFVHMRASNSFSAAIIMDLNGGAVVTLLPGGDDQWQKASYNGTTGFIFKTYLSY